MSIWNHRNRVAVYRKIKETFGPYNFENYHGQKLPAGGGIVKCPLQPKGVTPKEADAIFHEIHDTLVAEGVFGDRPPKRDNGIKAQVAHCMTTQSLTETASGYDLKKCHRRATIAKNRQAAYEAGFMTLTNIIKLEQLASELHSQTGINSPNDYTTKGQRVVELFRDYFEDHGLWEILENNGVNTDAVLESLGESMMLLVDDE